MKRNGIVLVSVLAAIAALPAAGPKSPTQLSAPSAPPSPAAGGVTTATEPPVLLHPPLTPKGTKATPPPDRSVPSYTEEQAHRGQIAFYGNCAECHGGDGNGQYGPALSTPDGNVQWQSVSYVYTYMKAHMPWGNASALPPDDYINIMAYLLKAHGHPAGTKPLTAKSADRSAALLGASQP